MQGRGDPGDVGGRDLVHAPAPLLSVTEESKPLSLVGSTLPDTYAVGKSEASIKVSGGQSYRSVIWEEAGEALPRGHGWSRTQRTCGHYCGVRAVRGKDAFEEAI